MRSINLLWVTLTPISLSIVSQRYRHKHMPAQMWRNTDIGTCSSVRYVTKGLLPFCCQFSTPILYTSGLTNTFPSSTFLYFSPPTFRTVIQMTVNNGELSWWIVHHFTDFQPIVVSGFLFPSVMRNHIFFSFLFFSFFLFFFFFTFTALWISFFLFYFSFFSYFTTKLHYRF